jgi:hypothetical protein
VIGLAVHAVHEQSEQSVDQVVGEAEGLIDERSEGAKVAVGWKERNDRTLPADYG